MCRICCLGRWWGWGGVVWRPQGLKGRKSKSGPCPSCRGAPSTAAGPLLLLLFTALSLSPSPSSPRSTCWGFPASWSIPAFSLHLLTIYLRPGCPVTTFLSTLLSRATMVSMALSPSVSKLLDHLTFHVLSVSHIRKSCWRL